MRLDYQYTFKVTYPGYNPRGCIISTSGVMGNTLSAAIWSGYGETASRQRGAVLINNAIVYRYSNSDNSFYVTNETGIPISVYIFSMGLLNFSKHSSLTTVFESDFGSEFSKVAYQ